MLPPQAPEQLAFTGGIVSRQAKQRRVLFFVHKNSLSKMKTAGRCSAVHGSTPKQNVRYVQQPSWLQSALQHNVHSVHLLKCKTISESSRKSKGKVSGGEQNTHYFAKANSHQDGGCGRRVRDKDSG